MCSCSGGYWKDLCDGCLQSNRRGKSDCEVQRRVHICDDQFVGMGGLGKTYLLQHVFKVAKERDYGGHAPVQQLEEEGRKIVKQCGNLPLAMKTIAASLVDATNLSTWKWKLHQLEQVKVSAVENEGIMAILKLRYDSLQMRLRACFAYLSFFAEDPVIDAEYLINLWIGEGFIPAGEHQLDEAWNCLHQFANLCLLQL